MDTQIEGQEEPKVTLNEWANTYATDKLEKDPTLLEMSEEAKRLKFIVYKLEALETEEGKSDGWMSGMSREELIYHLNQALNNGNTDNNEVVEEAA